MEKKEYNIENLIVTMNENDFSKYNELSLNSNAVISNQSNYTKYEEKKINNYLVKMITTNTRGVGINRNLALLYSSSDICVLSDDDMVYEKNYVNIIEEAYKKLKSADIIIFNIDTIGENMGRRINKRVKRINSLNFMNYGSARITFKRESIIKNNIWFSTLFGGGAKYSSGEDSLFLADSLKKGLRIYAYPVKIATVKQETSTWFHGFNEKFFFDKGALISQIHPRMKYFYLLIYFPMRFKSSFSFYNKQKLLISGMRAYKKCLSFHEWNLKNNKKGE